LIIYFFRPLFSLNSLKQMRFMLAIFVQLN